MDWWGGGGWKLKEGAEPRGFGVRPLSKVLIETLQRSGPIASDPQPWPTLSPDRRSPFNQTTGNRIA
jgi:hypothetical protein